MGVNSFFFCLEFWGGFGSMTIKRSFRLGEKRTPSGTKPEQRQQQMGLGSSATPTVFGFSVHGHFKHPHDAHVPPLQARM